MIQKLASALLVLTLAACPVLAQVTENVTNVIQLPGSPEAALVPAPQGYVEPLPSYVPAWTERTWFDSEFVMGFVRPAHLPALVTTSPAGTSQAQAGVLGTPNVSVLFGDRDVNGELRTGFREEFGCWFDNDRTLGFAFGFLWLTGLDQRYSASSNGSTILARPFTDAVNGNQSSLLVAYPSGSGPAGTSAAGTIAIAANSGAFYGVNFDFEESIINDPNLRLKSLLGFRYLHLNDSVDITQMTNPTGGAPAGTQIFTHDGFSAWNNFYGIEVGLQAEWIRGPFSANVLCKCSVGALQREVNVNGNTLITAPGNNPSGTSGGLLALPTNIGTFGSDTFTVVPELGLRLAWDVTPNVRLTAGYSALVLFNAVQSGNQIDSTVNSSLLNSSLTTVINSGTALRPAFSMQMSDVWVQTINLGMEFRY